MDPLNILMEEHRVIEKIIAVLDRIINKLNKGNEVDTEDLRKIVDFIRTFADKCHHGKEEGILFPKMIEKGIPKEGGPIGVMLEEHEIGRSAVREMSEGISLMEKGEVAGRERFVNGAVKYTELLKDHIYKEDHILYEMARTVFDSNDMDKLAEAFDRVEREDIGEGVHEKYLDIARYLAKKYLDEDIHHHHH